MYLLWQEYLKMLRNAVGLYNSFLDLGPLSFNDDITFKPDLEHPVSNRVSQENYTPEYGGHYVF